MPEQSKVTPRGRVFVVDDEEALAVSIARILQQANYTVVVFTDAGLVLSELNQESADVVITDIKMPGHNGLELTRDIKRNHPEVEVIVMTGVTTIQHAVEAMKAGAYDFLTKPFENADVVTLAVDQAMERRKLLTRTRFLETQVELRDRFENILGASAKMKAVFRMIESVAPVDTTVLILGESGTGKELVARAVHDRSSRRSRRFCAINCSAFTESLLESELFGHAKGAFTGATNYRKGILEEADGGTVFLDEVGEMTPPMQVKLLRFLQEGEIRPVGSNEMRKVEVRVLAATNVDLPAAVKDGRFREDLYYRINVVPIILPPLRDRTEDIPLLAHHFLRKYATKMKKNVVSIDPAALALIMAYRWPGNVRELENLMERLVVLSPTESIRLEDLPEPIRSLSDPNLKEAAQLLDAPFPEARQQVLAAFDKRYIEDVLARAGGVVAEAARIAHMDRSNFRRLMKHYLIDIGDYRHEEAGAS